MDGAGRAGGRGPLSLCSYTLCTLMLGSVSEVLLEAGREACGRVRVLDHALQVFI